MSRKQQHIQQLLPRIKEMLEKGMTQRICRYKPKTLPEVNDLISRYFRIKLEWRR